jgi:hypothetical protein
MTLAFYDAPYCLAGIFIVISIGEEVRGRSPGYVEPYIEVCTESLPILALPAGRAVYAGEYKIPHGKS